MAQLNAARRVALEVAGRDRVKEFASGCGFLIVLILSVLSAFVGVVVVYVGIIYVTGVMTEWAMSQSIVRSLLGVTLIVLAALGWLQVYRRRSGPEVTPRAVIYWGVVSIVMILAGVGFLMADFTDTGGTDTTGF